MALTQSDRELLEHCLNHDPDAWSEFIDRFLCVVYHSIHHTAHKRSVILSPDETDELASDIMAFLANNDYRVLRDFGGKASVATYLAVVSRRFVVNRLARRQAYLWKQAHQQSKVAGKVPNEMSIESQQRFDLRLEGLAGLEADIARKYYLEQKSFSEIGFELGVPEEKIGSTLMRFLERLQNEEYEG